MIHLSIFSNAIDTVIGAGDNMNSLASNILLVGSILGFSKSLYEQLSVCFSLVKNEKQKGAAVMIMIVPMMLIFAVLLITSMGMGYFLTSSQSSNVINPIISLINTPLFKIESVIISLVFFKNVKKVVDISKMDTESILIGFGVQILTAVLSILFIVLSFLNLDTVIFSFIPQILLRMYVYGLYMIAVSIFATAIAIKLHNVFRNDRKLSYNDIKQTDPWEITDDRKTRKLKEKIFSQNKQIAKKYIMGNNKYYISGLVSVALFTFILGYYFRFADGQEGVGNFLMLASAVYLPMIIIRLLTSQKKQKVNAYNTLIKSDNPEKWTDLFVEEIASQNFQEPIIETAHFKYIDTKNEIKLYIKNDNLNYNTKWNYQNW